MNGYYNLHGAKTKKKNLDQNSFFILLGCQLGCTEVRSFAPY